MHRRPQVMRATGIGPTRRDRASPVFKWSRLALHRRRVPMDEDGYFYMCSVKGPDHRQWLHVYPTEVEACSTRTRPVLEAAVIGILIYRGEAVRACVVLKPGARA